MISRLRADPLDTAGVRSDDQQNTPDPGRHAGVEIALRPDQAAAALNVSRDFFDERIAPDVPVIHIGRLKLYAVAALERWANDAGNIPVGR